jgi:hypothetical protein
MVRNGVLSGGFSSKESIMQNIGIFLFTEILIFPEFQPGKSTLMGTEIW